MQSKCNKDKKIYMYRKTTIRAKKEEYKTINKNYASISIGHKIIIKI